ncbi:GNAT family N-acetyltransferase [Metasolibacillus meyeri]|uniref:GNAT family N-acetyltransferase n=1 Tax=Metasolibacillus meyeri TaxID=1071052 RepID=UPI000D2F6A1E|nr:GNAT family N-acetyltransferase [Metasolibacillus meyeri]
MYWCKIATSEKEFAEIAALNYATFVEEIPQHPTNEAHRLVDKFHTDNTYLVVYKEQQLIGMLALRDKRPFSLDSKIGPVERYLNVEDCVKLCEVRLLAIKKPFRNGRVFLRLAQALANYLFERRYTACVISGTTREEKLYKQMGFQQFAEAVGTSEAQFLPMVLTREGSAPLRQRLRRDAFTFYPGPVLQQESLAHTDLSHRSFAFQLLFQELHQRLLALADAKYVTTLVGTGTLANEAMLAQLKSDFSGSKGLIITNGEFGERLVKQAKQQQLTFDVQAFAWQEPFDLAHIEEMLKLQEYKWLLYVHGETSTGMCNGEQLAVLAEQYGVALCADCISSFGACQFSLAPFYLATTVSGKAIGALSGLSFVFSNHQLQPSDAPLYMNLAHYAQLQIPFTLPAVLIHSALAALRHYPARFALLKKRMEMLQAWSCYQQYALKTNAYPMIVTFKLPHELSNLGEDLKLNGIYLHDESGYLQSRSFVQISIIQPNFEEAFTMLKTIYEYYQCID